MEYCKSQVIICHCTFGCEDQPPSKLSWTVQVAVLRMLKQLGQVYSVMKIDRLRKLVPFMDFGRVEAIIVDAVKNEYIQVDPQFNLLQAPVAQ